MTMPPPWQAHSQPDYDARMRSRCDALLLAIGQDPKVRQGIFADPRTLHRELFHDFTPAGCPEYAGTYRGTVGTTLERRAIEAESQLKPGETYVFLAPALVAGRMLSLLDEIAQWQREADDDRSRLLGLSYAFCWFGKIHPFLDGNGHVQRALFAAMAAEYGLSLSPRFAIHPRPYDRLLATALELFTASPEGEENSELALVAEYLGFFLDGPFQEPRANLLDASPYG